MGVTKNWSKDDVKELLEKTKEKLNLGKTKNKDVQKVTDNETESEKIGHIVHARYDIVFEHDFNVSFSGDSFIIPKYITAFEISNSARLITISANVTKETHYFGKPSVYTNAFTAEDMESMVFGFNKSMEYIDVTEFTETEVDDDEDNVVLYPVTKTRYHNPRIRSYSTRFSPESNKQKSWTFKIQYDYAETIKMGTDVPEEEGDVRK